MESRTSAKKRIKTPKPVCVHCGAPCDAPITSGENCFCCHGCKTVYEFLWENNLHKPGEPGDPEGRTLGHVQSEKYAFLDDDRFSSSFILFQNDKVSKVSLHLPQIHCTSCIYLLENLSRLNPAISQSVVNFTQRQADITFDHHAISLRGLVELLESVGYAPDLKFKREETKDNSKRALAYRIGVAGFCFGNIMLLAFPEYLGMEEEFDSFSRFFSLLALGLSVPVTFYSGGIYLVSAFKSLRARFINMDVPIAIGMVTLFGRSAYEILSGTGLGYLDSLAGLVFFLLIGRWFQQKTYRALSFDRDYTSYFPMAVARVVGEEEESVELEYLKPGDQVRLRNQELIPADGVLLEKEALIDYSFVTGESDPVLRKQGQSLYAGGRVAGSRINVRLTNAVDNSYLTQLWNQDVFKQEEKENLQTISNKVSRYFTLVVLLITLVTGIYWQFTDPSVTFNAITAVLIVACPCALALSVPFTYGSMMRAFGKFGLYLKDAQVIEGLSNIDTVVLDKTGTITYKDVRNIHFHGKRINPEQANIISSLAGQSTHPLSRSIVNHLDAPGNLEVSTFRETEGKGVEGRIWGHAIRIGSASFMNVEEDEYTQEKSRTYVCIDRKILGYFAFDQRFRLGMKELIANLQKAFTVNILSGDVSSQRIVMKEEFALEDTYFGQSPEDKLNHIDALQQAGRKVLMLGDGLNDAGALRQSDVGIAVAEDVSQFTPASSAIIRASKLRFLDSFLDLSHRAKRIVYFSFGLSFLYNIVGLAFAVSGQLSPVFAAILMPISSISVVAFTTLSVRYFSQKSILNKS